MAPTCITGVQDTGVHPRREIHEFVADHRQFSLFVQALLHMQEMDPEDPTSYYALAGIHGYPYQTWPASHSHSDDAGVDTTKNKTQWLGYCTHGTVLFPTWHRPYILALEQHLQSHATHLASLYTTPDAPSWHSAAHTLRMPYWDWALHPLPPPEVIEYETLWVTTCSGKREEVRNPLFSFVFPEGVRGEGFPKRYKGWGRTVRWPMSCDEEGRSDVDALKRALSGRNAEQTQAAVYRTLVNVHTWTEFSNHNAPACPCSFDATTTPSSSASASPSSPAASSLSSSPSHQQHHTTKHREYNADDYDDKYANERTDHEQDNNEQGKKKRKGKCHCRCAPHPEASLEGIHDTLHNLIGGGGKGGKGHMGSPAVAAYDPIFYLHHTNVDRLLAIWARLNPKTWVSRSDCEEDSGGGGGYSRRGTWSVPKGVWIDSRTELTPFGMVVDKDSEDRLADAHNEEEGTKVQKTRYQYWTSEDVRDTESFGYTYPELQDLHVTSSDDGSAEKLYSKTVHSKETEERKELERRVWAMYGRGVQGVFSSVGVVEEAVVSEREVSGDEEDEEDGDRDDEDGEGVQQVVEEGAEEGVMLSGDVDPQPHLAPLALPPPRPRLHSRSSPNPTRPKDKSTTERGARHTRNAGLTLLGVLRRNETRVWMWDWKARVRIREFEVGGGESVEVRVFLVPARELYEDEESVLDRSGRASTKAQGGQRVSPTSSPFPPLRTSTPSTYLTALSSSTLPSSSPTSLSPLASTSTHHYIPLSDLVSRGWDYDHPGYIGCVGTFLNELESAEMCGNCMARRGLGSESDESCEDEEQGSVVQGTVCLSERIVVEMRKEHDGTKGMLRERMKGLEPDVVLPFLRERLRWGVWTVANNAPIPFTSLVPGAVEVDVCATRMSLPASSLHGSGVLQEVGGTVWYKL